MQLNDLTPSPGTRKTRRRVGRGVGSGRGKTSGRGQKGQRSRSGGGVRPGFEGGQMPLYRRLPHRGFSNALFRTEYSTVNVADLSRLEDGTEVTPQLLLERRIVRKKHLPVKILGNGELTVKLTVLAHAFSETAREKILAAGGTCTLIEGAQRNAGKTKKG